MPAPPTFRVLLPDVQDALDAAIAAAAAGVPRSVGYPAGGPAAEQIWVGGEFEADTSRALSGAGQRGEVAVLEVRVVVTRTTDRYAEVRDRALAIAASVEGALLADPTLGGLVERLEVLTVKGAEAVPDERTRQYGVTLSVRYHATVPAA